MRSMLPRASSGVWTALGTHSPIHLLYRTWQKTVCSLLPDREDSIKEGVRDLKKARVDEDGDPDSGEEGGEPIEPESKEARQVRMQKERDAKKLERLNAKLEKDNEKRQKAEESRKRKLDAGADPALIKKQDRWVLEHGVSGAPQAHKPPKENCCAPSREQVQGASGAVVDQRFCHLVFFGELCAIVPRQEDDKDRASKANKELKRYSTILLNTAGLKVDPELKDCLCSPHLLVESFAGLRSRSS